MHILSTIVQVLIASGLLVFAFQSIGGAIGSWRLKRKLKELLEHELMHNLWALNDNLAMLERHLFGYFLRREIYDSILQTGGLSRFKKGVYIPLLDTHVAGEAFKLFLQNSPPASSPQEINRVRSILKRQYTDCRAHTLKTLKALEVKLTDEELNRRLHP